MPLTTLLTSKMMNLSDKLFEQRQTLLSEQNLDLGQDIFLLELLKNDGVTMGILAEKLSMTASSATKMATKLEKKGFISRKPSRIDSRQNHAFLTEEGKTKAKDIITLITDLDQLIIKKLKKKDNERLYRILEVLEAVAKGKKLPSSKKPKKAKKPQKSKDKKKKKS